MFRLAWFAECGTAPLGWNAPWSGNIGKTWHKPDHHIDLARALERACFDYIMFEDGMFITDTYRGSPDYALRNGYAVPKNDPMSLVPLVGLNTTHLGIIATMTTTFTPPFAAARLGATLDHLTEGRVGFNLVTAHNDRTAQNFGLEKMVDHSLRYEMASEWIEVADRLWRSWDADAIVDDRDNGTFIDPAKVHPIDFEGRFYKCRGPLNTAPGPQGRPVICQAGGSEAGKQFAAQCADTVLAIASSVDEARACRQDFDARLRKIGRRPEDLKIFFFTSLILAETEDRAADLRRERTANARANIEHWLFFMSFASSIDFSTFDLDAPLPPLLTNASKSLTARVAAKPDLTLRELASDPDDRGLCFSGTPASVADQMGEAMKEIGGDGYLLSEIPTRRTIAEITDGLAPALQRRGLIRSNYPYRTFRENLLSF